MRWTQNPTKVFANVKGYFAFLTQKGAMPQVLGLLRAWLYSICRFVQPRPDGCLSRIKRQSNTAYSIVQPWLDDRVSLICLYKLPDSWRRRQVGEHVLHLYASDEAEKHELVSEIKNRFEEVYKYVSIIEDKVKEDDVLIYTLRVFFNSLGEKNAVQKIYSELEKDTRIVFIRDFTHFRILVEWFWCHVTLSLENYKVTDNQPLNQISLVILR